MTVGLQTVSEPEMFGSIVFGNQSGNPLVGSKLGGIVSDNIIFQ
jgi:hypothetical protein